MDLKTLLSDDWAQAALKELNAEQEAPETQAAIIAQLGENVYMRVTAEVVKLLPEEKRFEFAELMDSNQPKALYDFLYPYIPNLDLFVKEEMRKELDATKALMQAA